MPVMEIPRFPRKIEIPDLANFIRARLSQKVVTWPEQAIPLLGYMCCPIDGGGREKIESTIRSWDGASEEYKPAIPKGLRKIQNDWLRIADIMHLVCDLAQGGHQARRGGASVGKAIALIEASAKTPGTKASNLWKVWSAYKDVAHLAAAATLVCGETRNRFFERPIGPLGLPANQVMPFQMAMLMPDLVLAVALEFERLGLGIVPDTRTGPVLSSETVWHIPPDINVVPIPPPMRAISPKDQMTLNKRRAGNRGKANFPRSHSSFS